VLPEGGDWRFGWHPSESAWYPTMECLRRPPGGDWIDVFEHIARRVSAIREGRSSAFDELLADSPESDAETHDDDKLA